jgi:hypothetical protein
MQVRAVNNIPFIYILILSREHCCQKDKRKAELHRYQKINTIIELVLKFFGRRERW